MIVTTEQKICLAKVGKINKLIDMTELKSPCEIGLSLLRINGLCVQSKLENMTIRPMERTENIMPYIICIT